MNEMNDGKVKSFKAAENNSCDHQEDEACHSSQSHEEKIINGHLKAK